MPFALERRSALSDADRSRLMRKLMEVEIKALEDLTAGSEASFDGIVERQSAVEDPPMLHGTQQPGELMSQLVDKYLDDTAREREWPSKTVLRKRGELREFLEIVGDKPSTPTDNSTASTSKTCSCRYRSIAKSRPSKD